MTQRDLPPAAPPDESAVVPTMKHSIAETQVISDALNRYLRHLRAKADRAKDKDEYRETAGIIDSCEAALAAIRALTRED